MSKFTPGPWEVCISTGLFVVVKNPPTMEPITIACSPSPHEWKLADAELIAIAPDMYKFLLDLTKYSESIDPMQFMGLKEEAWKIIKGVK